MRHNITFVNGDVTLAGTVWLPDLPGQRPGVVMVTGSGPTDRDNGVFFPPIREHLPAAGFAVLSYDKRGVGESTGNWLTSDYDALAADAAAAVGVLRARPEVDSESVGLFGHSEGGWVVLRAAGLADPAFVVTNSAPGLSVRQQDRWAISANLRATGVSEDGIAASEATYDQVLKWIGENVSFAEIESILNADPGYQHMVDLGSPLDEETWEFVKLVHLHDPFEDLVRLRCPHLALFGGTDLQIPVAMTASVFATAACERSGSARLTIETFPGVGHRFQAGDRFVPGYFETLTRWLCAAVHNDCLDERRAV